MECDFLFDRNVKAVRSGRYAPPDQDHHAPMETRGKRLAVFHVKQFHCA